MSSENTVTHWLRKLECGKDEAARELWERYFTRLVELARRRLGTSPRRVADEEDVALSVFRCLCAGAEQGRFANLANRDELWRLLQAMTKQKVIDQARKESGQKRGAGKVRGDSAFADADQQCAGFDQVASPDPTPQLLAIVAEENERLLRTLADEKLQKIAIWKLEGNKNDEIAKRLGVTRRTVERKLQDIRKKWSHASTDDAEHHEDAERVDPDQPSSADELLPLVYDELRKLAAARLAHEKPGQTLQPTALVHEAYMRLVGSQQTASFSGRGHFYAAAAEAMRRILIEQARRKGRQKRGGNLQRHDLPINEPEVKGLDANVLDVDEALTKLAVEHPEKADLVKLRYFGGLTLAEAAEALQISGSTADRNWKYARAWLARELRHHVDN